jgi:MFS family permease
MRRGPLAGRYPAAAAMVICALVPYLALSAALGPLTPLIARQLHMSLQTISLGSGMANAAYAVGTVLAVALAQHLPQRRMLIIYASLLVVGAVLAAAAQDPAMFIAGHILQGLCTSLLLIAAVPPLALGYPASTLRWTAVIMNMGIFGAVALGPLVGGIQAQAHAWRPLFWIITVIALVALLLSVLTFEDAPPADPSAPKDPLAIGLAGSGCVAAFYGASELATHRFLDAATFLPLVVGLALIVTLIVYQYHGRRTLLTIRGLMSTIPVAGITIAICAAAASVSATLLTSTVLAGRYSPVHLGLLYLPEFGGAVITAAALGIVFRTRLIHYLVLSGMVSLAVGIAAVAGAVPPSSAVMLVASGLIGLGIGGSVAPALFLAGFSLPSDNLQRVFALVELVRAVAAFMVAPIFAHLAMTVGGTPDAGTRIALWGCFGVAAVGTLAGVALYALGRVRPQAPAVQSWLDSGERGAWYSPPLLAGIRPASNERALAQHRAGASYDGYARPPRRPVSEPVPESVD